MLSLPGIDSLPQTFDQLVSIETRFLVFVVALLLVRHTHWLICFILGIPENWIMLLFRFFARKF